MGTPTHSPAAAGSHLNAVLRVVVFLVLAYAVQIVTFSLTAVFGLFVAATGGVFAGGAVATAVAMRIYRFGVLSDIGLSWHPAAGRHFTVGLLLGAGAAVFVVMLPVLLGRARFTASTEYPFSAPGIFMVGVLLLLGALGEELIFRGYPFQLLAGRYGRAQILLPGAVLFAVAHGGNPGSSHLALFNTFLWGVVLGYALFRAGDLWLPTALHFGWNFTLPLFGANLSGFRMGMTGQTLEWSSGPAWSGGDYGPEGSLLTTIAAISVLFVLGRAPFTCQPLLLLRASNQGEEELER